MAQIHCSATDLPLFRRPYEELIDLVDDLELGRITDARLTDGQEPVSVSLDAL